MIKEEIIVKTKADFDREIENLKFDINIFSPVILASGIAKRTKTYKITDYAAPVDTLVVEAITGHMYYSTGENNSANRELIVFADGRTSRTNRHNCRDHLSSWRWDNSRDAINFLYSKVVAELGNGFSCFSYLESQSVKVSYDVEVTVRLVEDKPEPTFNEFKGGDPELYGPEYNCRCHTQELDPVFKKGEKVLVWDYNKDYAGVKTFCDYNQDNIYKFKIIYPSGFCESWVNCAKICQKCEKEVCECKTEPTFKNDELVLVWDDDKDKAVLQYFEGYLDDKYDSYKFSCWDNGTTSFTANGFAAMWEHCVKVCQKCGKEKCECR